MKTNCVEIRYGLPLTDADKRRIETFFSARYPGAEFRYCSAPELIGGFVARCGDEVWDASVLSRLDRLKEDLS